MKGQKFRERTIKNHHVHVREFVDMDGGSHYKWTFFSCAGKEYPIGSNDIIRHEDIDWEHTKSINRWFRIYDCRDARPSYLMFVRGKVEWTLTAEGACRFETEKAAYRALVDNGLLDVADVEECA